MNKLALVGRFGSNLTATEISHMVGEPIVFASISGNAYAWMLAFPDGSAMFAPYGATGYGSYYSNHAATVNDWQSQLDCYYIARPTIKQLRRAAVAKELKRRMNYAKH